jgi:hypothetical protein
MSRVDCEVFECDFNRNGECISDYVEIDNKGMCNSMTIDDVDN